MQIKKMLKWTSFGVDMFFSQTFGVDMFFSNLCKSKNGENLLILVLTCFFLKLLVLTCFSQTRASQKMGKMTSFGVDGLKLRTMGKIA